MRAVPRRRLAPEVRRREIVDAAERLLKRHGPTVRVEDVVREAAAAKGTFYLYFPTWDDLLEELRRRLIKSFDDTHHVQLGAGSGPDWLRVIDELAVAFVDTVVAIGGLHSVLFHTDFARRRPIPDDDNPPSRFTAIVRAGQAAGAFADIDADSIGRLLFAVIHEAADAVAAGEDRERILAAMRWTVRRMLEPEVR